MESPFPCRSPRRAAIRRIATSAILLEGGFDEEETFVYLPFSGLEKMTEYFRRTVLRFFTDKKLLNEHFARNMLSWRHSGFSQDAWPSSERSERPGIDNSVRILDESSRDSLAQYMARPPQVFHEVKIPALPHIRHSGIFEEDPL